MRRAIVVGAGLAGLAASRALAPHFEQVLVLERDDLPDGAAPRDGVPQGRHPHVLLGGGQRALAALAPELERDLLALGAVQYRVGLDLRYDRPGFDPFPRRDLGWSGLAMSRPLLELSLRRLEQRNVELRPSCRVERLLLAGGDRVEGVSVTHAGRTEALTAELVVDASGRGALTLDALAASGCPVPEETRIEVDMGYATAIVRLPEGAVDWLGLMVLPDAPSTSRGALLLPLEGGRSIILVVGRGDEKPGAGWDGFSAAVAALRTPTLMQALRQAERLEPPIRFGFAASVWRHFERLGRWPRGLLPLGDAICRFNPVYGQGMSVAAQQAVVLAQLLDERAQGPEPLAGLAETYFARVAALLDAPWALAALPDLVFPDTRGERPPDLVQRLAFSAALTRLAADDAAVHALTMRVQHLIEPRSAFAQPWLRERVQQLMNAGGAT